MKRGEIRRCGGRGEIYEAPANTFVAKFVGSPPMNLVEGRIEHGSGGLTFHGAVRIAAGQGFAGVSPGQAPLGVRPEHVEIVAASHPDAIAARVDLVERVGSDSNVLMIVAGQAPMIASVAAAAAPLGGHAL